MGYLKGATPGGYPAGASELVLAAHDADQAIASIRAAIANPHPQTIWDHELLHAVRMIRLAAYHAFKARPDLKPPDSYDEAIARWKRSRHG